LDVDRMLALGPIVVEWAERIKEILPEDNLWIQLRYTGVGHRSMILTTDNKRYQRLLENLRRKLYGVF